MANEKDTEKLDVERTSVKLKMDFDIKDIIDVLVSEQEQNLENQIENQKTDLKDIKEQLKLTDDQIDEYLKAFAESKYSEKIVALKAIFDDIGINAAIRFEVIDGNILPSKRPILTTHSEHKDKSNKIILAMTISNKEFDRSTVDGTVCFHIESDYDDHLLGLYEEREKTSEKVVVCTKNLNKLEDQLSKTDRLIRRARAAVTSKAVGQDINVLLADFRQQFPQIELKQK